MNGDEQQESTESSPTDLAVELRNDDLLLSVFEQSQDLGFLGPGPVVDHVEHACGFLPVLDRSGDVLDLGSGGGLPGLVLVRALPEVSFVLLDAMERRCAFLEHAAEQLGVTGRVSVVCGRAEELARDPELRGRFATVVTRSFGAPAVTAECAAGFLRTPHGRLVVSEPPEPDPARWPAEGLARLGLRAVERHVGAGVTVQVLEAVSPLDDRFPRRTGVPAKRPLF